MFHGKISPEIAQGLKVLRERIERVNIPPSILDETLNFATWNIREFGRMRQRRRRILPRYPMSKWAASTLGITTMTNR